MQQPNHGIEVMMKHLHVAKIRVVLEFTLRQVKCRDATGGAFLKLEAYAVAVEVIAGRNLEAGAQGLRVLRSDSELEGLVGLQKTLFFLCRWNQPVQQG